MEYKSEVLHLLKKAGWFEDRKVNRDEISETLRNEGYPVLERVVDFLAEFWGIVIYFENKRNGIKKDDISFDFEKATHLEVPERINEDYSKRIGKELCLVGSAYRDYMVLIMSDDGCVYGGYDDFLCKIADTGPEAIEAIVFGYEFSEIS
ncbi:MAG: SUKH-3 domain-containing protein [Bacteroidetes bacterium]|nr:SUKH-3 domain-containing protein [Bacteroidota bacterium]